MLFRASGALFARKFHPTSCCLSDWLNVMKQMESPSTCLSSNTPVHASSIESENPSAQESGVACTSTQTIEDNSESNPRIKVECSDDVSTDELGISNLGGSKRARNS